jgi:hypothetical protein
MRLTRNRWGRSFWAGVALIFFAASANAQGYATGPGDSSDNPLGSPPGTRWRNGAERWFVATRLDAGFFFLRPRVSTGYGRPHYSWIGVDVVPILSTSAVGGYMGGRVEGNYFELRSGMLFQYSFNRSYLPAASNYGRRDIDIIEGPRAQYWLWDSELELYLPLGRVKLRSQTQPVFAGGLPEDHNLYIDTLWVVAGPGLTLRERFGMEFFWPGTNIGITPAVEVLWLEARNTAVVRAGVQLRWLLCDEFEVRTTILPVVYSPDQLGRSGGDVLELALRWRWASPEAPGPNPSP